MNDIAQTVASTEQKSILGRTWKLVPRDEEIRKGLARRGARPEVCDILSSRGIPASDLDAYLAPTIKDSLPEPFSFIDMEKGVKHVAQAMIDKKAIGVWTDYDADGIGSGALMQRFFRIVGYGEEIPHVPDRIVDGYGPNAPGLIKKKEEGYDTIIILDSGIVAYQALDAARNAGLDVVVIDHHEAAPEPMTPEQEADPDFDRSTLRQVPTAVAVINANRHDEKPGFGHLCAAGMGFIFCVGLMRELDRMGWFDGKDGRPHVMPQQELFKLVELVGLSTVADVMLLTGLNRAYVTRALDFANKPTNPGIAAICKIAKRPGEPVTSKDFGWVVGPRVNAAGRIASASIAIELLTTDDPAEAARLAEELEALNARRKEIESAVTGPAIEMFKDRVPGEDRKIAIAVVEDAHEGVVGISAGRLKEAYDCPAIVLARDHHGNLKGSARSVPGFSVGHGIISARQASLIIGGGGHDMAGGLTIAEDKLEAFEEHMNARIRESEYFRVGVPQPVDIEIKPEDLTVDLIDTFARMEPFGNANEAPRINIMGAHVRDLRTMKDKHIKLVIDAGRGSFDALLWNCIGLPIGDFLQNSVGSVIDILGNASINEFNGKRSPQIIIDDVRENILTLA